MKGCEVTFKCKRISSYIHIVIVKLPQTKIISLRRRESMWLHGSSYRNLSCQAQLWFPSCFKWYWMVKLNFSYAVVSDHYTFTTLRLYRTLRWSYSFAVRFPPFYVVPSLEPHEQHFFSDAQCFKCNCITLKFVQKAFFRPIKSPQSLSNNYFLNYLFPKCA